MQSSAADNSYENATNSSLVKQIISMQSSAADNSHQNPTNRLEEIAAYNVCLSEKSSNTYRARTPHETISTEFHQQAF
jgi:hypothetical protein